MSTLVIVMSRWRSQCAVGAKCEMGALGAKWRAPRARLDNQHHGTLTDGNICLDAVHPARVTSISRIARTATAPPVRARRNTYFAPEGHAQQRGVRESAAPGDLG